MLSCAVYSTIMKYTAPKFFNYRPLKRGELKKMILVSVIFIVNIVLSNSSLKFNSLALDQVRPSCFVSNRCSVALCLFLRVFSNLSSIVLYAQLVYIYLSFLLSLERCWCVLEMYAFKRASDG